MLLLAALLTAADAHECPPGFSRTSPRLPCYAFGSGPATRAAAASYCASYRAVLACPTSDEEVAYLGRRAAEAGRDLWIGLTDVLVEGQWAWPGICSTTAQLESNRTLPWCPGEPNNGGGGSQRQGTGDGGDCVRVVGRTSGHCPAGAWSDYRCDASHGPQHGDDLNEFGFVCEFAPDKLGNFDSKFLTTSSARPADEQAAASGECTAAIVWAVLLALALLGSVAANVFLWRERGLGAAAAMRAAARSRASGSTTLAEATPYLSSYEAPLRPLGVADSSTADPV